MEKKTIILGLLILSGMVFGIQYIGNKKLCCIDSNNIETCLINNESYDFGDSDITCNLYELDYTINKDNLIDLPTRIFAVITSIVVLYIFFLITRRK